LEIQDDHIWIQFSGLEDLQFAVFCLAADMPIRIALDTGTERPSYKYTVINN
jgi:hypothetical protein